MPLYTLKSEREILSPLSSYSGNSNWVRNQLSSLGFGPSSSQTQIYNAIGREAGQKDGNNDNFFTKRAKSLENAFGTTGSALISAIDTANENKNIEERNKKFKENMDDIYKKYGYNSSDEYYDAKDAAEKQIFGKYGFNSEDYWNKHADLWSPNNTDSSELKALEATRQNVINRMSKEDADKIKKFDTIQDELKGQSAANANEAKKASEDWRNYRENSYVGQKINQDRGKFAGSAINTLSTMTDVMLPTAGVALNAVQGGVEGIADELEENGLKNFDWNRAGQNALIGTATGAVTGGLNKGINKIASSTGNLLPSNNVLGKVGNAGVNATRKLLNYTPIKSNNIAGQLANNVYQGSLRGAMSGGYGGATGAGLSAALNGQDVLGSAIEGYKQGVEQGAMAGGIMGGANTVLRNTPGVGNAMKQLDQAGENWQKSGNDFNERLTNTLTSGDSGIGNWLQGKPSKILNTVGGVGNRIQDVSGGTPNKYVSVDSLGNRTEYTPNDIAKLIDEYDNYQAPKTLSGNSSSEAGEVLGDAGSKLLSVYDTMSGGNVGLDPVYNKRAAQEFQDWISTQRRATMGPNKMASSNTPAYTNLAKNVVDELEAKYGDLESAGLSDLKFLTRDTAQYDDKTARAILSRTANRMRDAGETRIATEINDALGNPTTLGGWLKKAGERIVEDANNRGMGMSIKNVGEEPLYSEDIGNLKINDNTRTPETRSRLDEVIEYARNNELGKYGHDDIKNIYESGDINAINRLEDAWREANQGGVINAARKQFLGQGIPNSADAPRLTQEMVQKNTPQTQVYRALSSETPTRTDTAWDNLAREAGYKNYDDLAQKFAQENPGKTTDAGKIMDWLDSKVPESQESILQRAKQMQNEVKSETFRNRAAEDLLNQVGTAKAPAAKADNMIENVKKFIDEGLTKPEEWQLASNAITGQNGVMSRLHRNLMENAGTIDTFSGKGGKYGVDLEDTIDYYIKSEGLVDSDAKGVKNEIMAVIESLPSRTAGSLDMSDNASDVMTAIRELEAHRRNYVGENSKNYGTTTPYKEQKARVIKDVASLLENRIYDKVPDATKVVTPEAIQELKNIFPKNGKWAKSMDKLFANIKTGKDLRAAQKRYVQTADYLENIKQNYGTYGQKVGDAYGNVLSQGLKRIPVVGGLLAEAANVPAANRLYATINSARADKLEKRSITNILSGKTSDQFGTPETPAGKTFTPENTPATQLYNAIGRTEGQIQGNGARNANYLASTAQEAEVIPQNTLEDLAATQVPNAGATSMYESAYGQPTTQQGMTTGNSYFPMTGDYWTDTIARAMTSAIEADDADAFATLYDMYQSQLASLQKQGSSSSSNGQKLTATQQAQLAKLDSADSAIDELEGLFNNAGGGKGPIIGNLQSIAGSWGWDSNASTYNQMAEGLVNQIAQAVGKSDSLNTEGEVKRALQLIPQLTDDAQTANNKLEELRRMLQTTKASYSDAYGLTSQYGSNMAY